MPATVATLLATAPYLAELARREPALLEVAADGDPDAALQSILASLDEPTAAESIGAGLRIAKGRVALLAAVAEVTGRWSPAQSTAALSDLADAALEAGLAALLTAAAEKGQFSPGTTPASSGLALFALGKHGGRELNYSSDIDIVAFFDPERAALTEPAEAVKVYGKIVRSLVGLMQDRTEIGYVFRTDLRLRPDPGSTPVAISFDAALSYYESRGQNWERAAWIKARPCAGDIEAGEAFLAELSPYVWRKHLDFATIADIQAMKRQINISKNVGAARVAGHNVKLGRGGIREIEFFTQTQQLIAGGRDRSLRVRPTAEALTALAAAGWIATEAAEDLTAAYWFLRAVENRLQMLRDEQTHSLPEAPEEIADIGRLMGDLDLPAFEQRYRAALATVSRYYAQLFPEGESLGTGEGDLVFTGSDDDPGTLETLSVMGFADPKQASATIRKWHYGGYAATRAAVSRAHLTELLPLLLRTLAAAGNADEALLRFDRFLSALPSGVQLFALLRTHEHLRTLLIAFMASAPRMADAVIHRVHVVDGLLDPAFAEEIGNREVLRDKVETFLAEGDTYEAVIDRARIIGQEQKFLICAGLLSGNVTAQRAGELFTALAETLLRCLLRSVREEFERRHGVVAGAQLALLAFGKMAAGEMTATSDLDFILLYDHPEEAEPSDGPKPLAPSLYFTRLTQRLIAAVTAPTAEGVLYHADMRLRPSGNAGPLATSLRAFAAYHAEHAWTWEHLALSRARVVQADSDLGQTVEGLIAAVLTRPRDAATTVDDVVSMRSLMARERKPRHRLDLKLASGGLVDIEFVAQSGQLLAGRAIGLPQAPTTAVLRGMAKAGLLSEGERLAAIHGVFSTVLQVTSAALPDPFKEEGWSAAFRDLLASLANAPTFDRLAEEIEGMRREVETAAATWYELARSIRTQ